MPNVRRYPGGGVVNGKIYIIGGDRFGQGPVLSTVEEYDTGFISSKSVNSKGKLSMTWGKDE
jgi:hypothetical protein